MSDAPTASPPPAPATPANALCLDCDYPLRDLAELRCPECGRPFDPAVPDTMNLSGRPLGRARMILCGVGWPTHLVAIAAVLVAVWGARGPGYWYTSLLAVSLGALVLGSVLSAFILRAIIIAWFGRPRSEYLAGWWRWLVAPALLAIWMLFPVRAIRSAGFRVSRPALERLVAEALCDPARLPPPRRAGVHFARVEAIHAGAVHIHTGSGPASRCGYAYFPSGATLPAGEPSPPAYIIYTHVADRWYEYESYWGFSGPVPPTSAPASAPAPAEPAALPALQQSVGWASPTANASGRPTVGDAHPTRATSPAARVPA